MCIVCNLVTSGCNSENQNTDAVSRCQSPAYYRNIAFWKYNRIPQPTGIQREICLHHWLFSPVGTLILALAGSELSYERPVIIFTNRPAGCLEEWKDQLPFYSVWDFCLFAHAKYKSPEEGGMKRKFKVCGGMIKSSSVQSISGHSAEFILSNELIRNTIRESRKKNLITQWCSDWQGLTLSFYFEVN